MIFQYMDKDLKKKKNSLFSYIVDSRKVPKDIYMHHNKFNFCIYKKKKKKKKIVYKDCKKLPSNLYRICSN